nr:HAMP domain-containing sensor histidine kinase [uncultured Mediterraneibacter sp.]
MKRIKMKNSLSRQMTMVFVCLLAFVLCVLFIVNARFLSRYYMSHKQQDLVNTYEEIVDAQKNGTLSDEETQKKLQYGLEKTNIDVYAMYVDDDKNMVITNVKEGGLLYKQMLRIFFSKDDDMAEKSVLLKTDDYVICKMTDTQSNTQYLEMWGYLDDEGFVTMRSPLESIRDSATLANQFLIYMGLIGMIVGGILVWFFSRRITRPVMELAQLSEDMANLNFEAKYTSGGKNEIGILGENFNKMSSQLEKTVSELKTANNQLQKDIEQKEKLEDMRNEFLGNVSHELKTPIALIQGYAEGLKEGVNDDPESREFYCDVIMDEANKMNQMVKNLLTLNQLEFGSDEVEFERFDLVRLVKGVIASCDILIQQAEASVDFVADETAYVWGDEFKTEQVFRNYLTNAIHHVDNEKRIEVRIIPEDGKVRVSVFNSGKPIPEEDVPKLWDKFYKVDKAHTREYGGNGIGLSIVKAIMESFHQQYGVKNYDNGVEFWFELDAKS